MVAPVGAGVRRGARRPTRGTWREALSMVEDDEGGQRVVWPTKTERLQVFYRQLKEAPAVTGMDEAVELLARTLLSVEDRISGIERGPGTRDDGRMYPAKADNRHAVPGR